MSNFNQKIIGLIPLNAEIVIYGAGFLGIDLSEYIERQRKDVTVKFFIDKTDKPIPAKVYNFETALKFLKEDDLILIASAPPNSIEMEQLLKKNGFKNYLRLYDEMQINRVDRACHKENLFIREDGNIYPCCLLWGIERYKIGNLSDKNLLDKIDAFDVDCKCDNCKLIKGNLKACEKNYESLNIELSYKCQAKCAMCCVEAPDIDSNYEFDNYDAIEDLIKKLKPKWITVQGGEILIQPESLKFIRKIKGKYGTSFSLITNGNNCAEVKQAEELFDSIIISFVGFQPETYKCLMGLDIERTKKFCSQLNNDNKTRISLKYLISPNNIHEIPLFIEWAFGFKNVDIINLDDSNTAQYINFRTKDCYWQKVIERTRVAIFKVLKKHKKENKIKKEVQLSTNVYNLLKIDKNEWSELFKPD